MRNTEIGPVFIASSLKKHLIIIYIKLIISAQLGQSLMKIIKKRLQIDMIEG